MQTANRVMTAVLGLLIAAVGLLAVGEAVRALTGMAPGPLDADTLNAAVAESRWSDPVYAYLAAGLVVAGLILVWVELRPRRPATLPVGARDRSRTVDLVLERRGLERRLAHLIEQDPDVVSAQVKVGRFRTRLVLAILPMADGRAVQREARAAAEAEWAQLGLRWRLRTRSSIIRSKRRVR